MSNGGDVSFDAAQFKAALDGIDFSGLGGAQGPRQVDRSTGEPVTGGDGGGEPAGGDPSAPSDSGDSVTGPSGEPTGPRQVDRSTGEPVSEPSTQDDAGGQPQPEPKPKPQPETQQTEFTGVPENLSENISRDLGAAAQRGDIGTEVRPEARSRAIAEAKREVDPNAVPFTPNAPQQGTTVRGVGEGAFLVSLKSPGGGRQTVPIAFAGPRTDFEGTIGPAGSREAVAPFQESEDQRIVDAEGRVTRLEGARRAEFRAEAAADLSEQTGVDLGREDVQLEEQDGQLAAEPTGEAREQIERAQTFEELQEATPQTRLSRDDVEFTDEGARVRTDALAGGLVGDIAREQARQRRAVATERQFEQAERSLEQQVFGVFGGGEVFGVDTDLQPGEDFTFEQTEEGVQAQLTPEFQRERARQQILSQLEAETGAELDPDDVELVDVPETEESGPGVIGGNLPVVGDAIRGVGEARARAEKFGQPVREGLEDVGPTRRELFAPLTLADAPQETDAEIPEDAQFAGQLTTQGREAVAVQTTVGSNIPVVGGATTTVTRGRLAAVRAGEPLRDALAGVSDEVVGGATAIGVGGVATPEPTTSAGGALLLGGLVAGTTTAAAARETGQFDRPPARRTETTIPTAATAAGSQEAFTSELDVPQEQFASELQPGETVVTSELRVPEGEPVSTTEAEVPTGSQFPSELQPGDRIFEPELTPGEQVSGGTTGPADSGRAETVVPEEFPLAGRDVPADPTRDFVSGESGQAVAQATPQLIGEQEVEEVQRQIPVEILEPRGPPDQPGPSTRERQRREDLQPFDRMFPTGGAAVVGEDSLLEQAERLPGEERFESPFERTLEETSVPGQPFTETATSFGPLARQRVDFVPGIEEGVDVRAASLDNAAQGSAQGVDIAPDQLQGTQQGQIQQQALRQAQRQRVAQQTRTPTGEETVEIPAFEFRAPEEFVRVPGPGFGSPATQAPGRASIPDEPGPDGDRRDDEFGLFDRRFEFDVTEPGEVAETVDRSLDQLDRNLADDLDSSGANP